MSYVDRKSVLAIGILYIVLAVFPVTARLLVKKRRKLGLGADDRLCLPAPAGSRFLAAASSWLMINRS